MIAAPEALPDDPAALKQLLLAMLQARQSDLDKITQLQEQVALLRHKLFSPSPSAALKTPTPQLAMLNEAEELIGEQAAAPSEAEEAVASFKRRGKRKPLPANLPALKSSTLPYRSHFCRMGRRD